MSTPDLDQTLRDIWQTRPHRTRSDRKIAGVAAAIARRYRIDPVLVRVGFVVITVFGGVGIMAYVLGWLLLPVEGDEVSGAEALLGRGRSRMSRRLAVVLAVVLAIATVGSGLLHGQVSALLSATGAAAALYLLHRHRGGEPGAPPDAAATHPTVQRPAAAEGPPTAQSPGGDGEGTEGPEPAGPGRPPAWDPLGVAPFAWDLPEPAPARQPAQPGNRRRSAVTPVTMALSLMAGGAAAIVALTSSGVGAAEVAAVSLAVVGAGLVAGSFLRGGRGLIAVAIPLALATYALAVVPGSRFGPQHGVGERNWHPSAVADVRPLYRLSAGDVTLDLRDLALTGTDTVRTTVQLGAGELTVLLPAGPADVRVHCEAGVGDLRCLDGQESGFGHDLDRTDLGSDGGDGGGTIVLTASVGAGQVAVSRG